MDELIYKNISLETLDEYKKCFDNNGSKKIREVLKWQLLENPIEKKFAYIALNNQSKAAGTYAVLPSEFKIGESTFLGSQAIDAMTDVNFRGQGLFIKLAKDVYENAEKDGVKLVFGFPNGQSVHGHQNKLGWNLMDPLPFLLKPLNTQYFSKKIKMLSWLPNVRMASKSRINKDIKISLKNEFPSEVNDIWEKFSRNIKVAVIRNKKYMEWRYLKKPLEDYQIAHAYTKENEYIGYIIYCVKGKHGGKIAYIMEYIYNPKYSSLAKNLMKFACNEAIEKNADCILAWGMEHSENYINYKSSGFYNLPEKLRPIELHFGAKAFDKNLKDLISNRENWYLSYSDSDTV
ncbi:GNAT family N-acetyltransferase [Brumimicrobium mesophilum]|uniref:GNAT family N-acetyltransferase n=1 Tax=Brumimicrobium mesophilum TaxID=392717 RepID=UPI000D14401D|nr:GNAT family N-acetyltransferase [Brumimicrobium mesophilum]